MLGTPPQRICRKPATLPLPQQARGRFQPLWEQHCREITHTGIEVTQTDMEITHRHTHTHASPALIEEPSSVLPGKMPSVKSHLKFPPHPREGDTEVSFWFSITAPLARTDVAPHPHLSPHGTAQCHFSETPAWGACPPPPSPLRPALCGARPPPSWQPGPELPRAWPRPRVVWPGALPQPRTPQAGSWQRPGPPFELGQMVLPGGS